MSRTRAATRQRLIDAAVELAEERGYENMTMRDVAERASVTGATAYQYFASKDHLLVETLLELARRSSEHFVIADTASSRPAIIRRRFRRMIADVERRPRLYEAMFRAYVSGSLESRRPGVSQPFSDRTWIHETMVEDDDPGQNQNARTLSFVVLGCMVSLAGGASPDRIYGVLDHATRVLFDDE